MILSLVILVPLSVAAVWFYWRSAPPHCPRERMLAYNIAVVIVAGGLSTSLVLYLRASLGSGPDRAWWPVLGALGWLLLVPLLLGIAGLLRNFVIFRDGASKR